MSEKIEKPETADVGKDARIRQWIIDQVLLLVPQNSLGSTLGILVSELKSQNNKDIKGLSDEGFYHRVHRALSEMVDMGLVYKDGTRYFYREPQDRVLAALETIIEDSFPFRVGAKDLAPFRAALEGLVEKKTSGPTKTARPKRGTSKIED